MTAKIEQEIFDKGIILKLSGQFTGGYETDDFQKEVNTVFQANQNLIVDFTETKYLSSIVIGLILKNKAEFQKKGNFVVYCGFNQTLVEVLQMTKVWSQLEITEDLESAKKIIK